MYSPDPGAVAEVVLYVLVVLVFTVFGFALGVVVFLDSVTNVRGIVCVWLLYLLSPTSLTSKEP